MKYILCYELKTCINNTTKIMKQLYFLFLIIFFPIFSFGQSEYFLTDSLKSVGIKLIDGGDRVNSRVCKVKTGDKIVEYSPYEIKEFGFKDGRIYISKEIQISDSSVRVFLECLHKGKTTLYYYMGKKNKTFFIEKDSTLFVEVPKKNIANECYHEILLNITNNCPNIADACKIADYNKLSLTKLITRYNQCILKPFPHFRYGLSIGYEKLRINPSVVYYEDIKYFDFKSDGGFIFSFFIDNPIQASDFSCHAEVLFSKHGYSLNHTASNEDLDLIINISSLNLPLLIRYTFPINNMRPFFNTGAMYTYNLKNEIAFYKTSFSGNLIEISDRVEKSILSTNVIGYVLGCGFEYDLNPKNAVFFELRYCKQLGLPKDVSNKNSIIGVSTGINF